MWLRGSLLRFSLAILLVISVLFAPWWVCFILGVVLNVRYRAWEVVVAGILYDLLWMPGGVSFSALSDWPLGTIVGFALVLLLEPLRRRLLVE